jgi:exonuclease VII small subunit
VAISLYNIAAELEAVANLDESINTYKKAYEFIKEYIGQ